MDEGVVKFRLFHTAGTSLPNSSIARLMYWRTEVHRLGGIGVDESGTGYGNISERRESGFAITGSQTGGVDTVGQEHFALVTRYDIDQNSVWCVGPVAASSESLTHAALYESLPAVRGVIHIHSAPLWEQMAGNAPTTSADIPYGTPEMARAVSELVSVQGSSAGSIVMAGHWGGLLFYGSTLDEAGSMMLKAWRDLDTRATHGLQ